MKKKFFVSLLAFGFVLPAMVYASSRNDNFKCKTKYPVVMVHGVAVKDKNLVGIDYWWGIYGELKDKGAEVFVTNQNCFQSHAFRGEEVFKELLNLRAIYGYEKFNLIAHSQGALDSRYLIANCSAVLPSTDRYTPGKRIYGYEMVKSLSMVSGVNRGSKIIDAGLTYVPSVTKKLAAAAINIFAKIFYCGEDSNDVLTALKWLSHKYMTETFNPNTPDNAGVYYQSWAGKMKFITGDIFLQPTYAYIKLVEGDNDGCVPVESAKWGKFRGVISGAFWSGGVSHFNEVGHMFGVTPGFNAPGFYVDMVEELKNMGF